MDGKTREKTIQVYNQENQYLSSCTRKRAAQMVDREKAKWIGYNKLLLFYTEKEFTEVKRKVWERDAYICYLCDEQLNDDTATVDHVTPRNQGGKDTPDNLACCCKTCNNLKDSMTYEEFFEALYNYMLWHEMLLQNYERRLLK